MSQINLHGNHKVTDVSQLSTCVTVTIKSNSFSTIMFFGDTEELTEFIDQLLLHTHKLEAQNATETDTSAAGIPGADAIRDGAE
jgi:hypothetical protein